MTGSFINPVVVPLVPIYLQTAQTYGILWTNLNLGGCHGVILFRAIAPLLANCPSHALTLGSHLTSHNPHLSH